MLTAMAGLCEQPSKIALRNQVFSCNFGWLLLPLSFS
jgi:hypothetical protein